MTNGSKIDDLPLSAARWARTHFGADDPKTVRSLEKTMRRWARETAPAIERNDDPDRDALDADLMAAITLRVTNDGPVRLYAIHNRATANLLFRRQSLHHPELRAMSIRELTRMMQGDNFGYKYSDSKTSGYLHDLGDGFDIKNIVQNAAYNNGGLLARRMLARMGVSSRNPEDSWDHPRQSAIDDVMAAVDRYERKRVRGAVREFLGQMDQNAMRIVRRARLFAPRLGWAAAYEWLIGFREERGGPDNFYRRGPAADAAAIANRQSTAEKYPALLRFLTGFMSNRWRDMAAEIDRNGNDLDTVGRYLRLYTDPDLRDGPWISDPTTLDPYDPEFMRWMRSQQRIHLDGLENDVNPPLNFMTESFAVAAALPRDWRPRNAADWDACERVADQCKPLMVALGRPFSAIVRDFAKLAQKTDDPALARMIKTAPDAMDAFRLNAERSRDHDNLNDFMVQVTRPVIIPAIMDACSRLGGVMPICTDDWTQCDPTKTGRISNQLARAVFAGFSLESLYRQAARWHGRANRLQTRTNTLDGAYEWAPLFAPFTDRDGTRFECLTSTDQLQAEGAIMGNCVGGYTHKCVIGHSHIVRVTVPGGAERTLVELEDGFDALRRRVVTVVQAESDGNTPPGPIGQMAVNRLSRRLSDGAIPLDWAAVERAREKARADYRARHFMMATGFDPADGVQWNAAYRAHHFEMPKLYREPTLDEFLEKRGIHAALDDHFAMRRG